MTRPIYEPVTQREIRKLGFGSDQLFRRPAPTVTPGLLPFAYFEVPNFTMVSGDSYSLGLLDTFFVGSIEGIATSLVIGNPPATDDGFFYSATIERGVMLDAGVGAGEAGCMVAIDAGLYFPTGFTGVLTMYVFTSGWGTPFGGLSGYYSPTQNVYQTQIIDPPNGTTIHLSGTAVWSGSSTDPDTQSVGDLLFVVVDQNSGADAFPAQGWLTFMRLSPMITSQFIP